MHISLSTILASALTVFLAGCATDGAVPDNLPLADAGSVQDLQVIDCLLPGKVRKLGQSMTYLSPRRAIRTTASDCEIRGGEYTAYDRANYATALKIWLPQAEQGDPAAQTYVGEIYEKGLGIMPDYQVAAMWYTRAAEQGYSRAQINLGYLYESGLGVQRDLTMAMNWYRRASGLSEGNLEYVSSVEIAQRAAVETQRRELQGEVKALRSEVERLKKELNRRRNVLNQSEKQARALREQIASMKQAAASAPDAVSIARPASSDEISRLQNRLDSADQERKALVRQLAEQQLATVALRSQLTDADTALENERQRLAKLNQELKNNQQQLRQSELAGAGKQQLDTENIALQAKVKNLQAVINKQEKSIAALERTNAGRQQELQRKIGSSDERETELESRIAARDRELAEYRLQLSERDQTMIRLQGQLTSIEQERQRLEKSLVSSNSEAEKLRSGLETAEQQLDERRMAMENRRDEIALLREELARQKAKTGDAAGQQARVSELENRLADLSGSLQKMIMEMMETEKEFTHQKTTMTDELSRVKRQAREMQVALNSSTENVSSLERQLRMAEMQKEVSGKEIEALEARLRQQEAEIAMQKKEISSVQARVSADSLSAQEPVQQLALIEPVAVGPTIEIIEPPVVITRGTPMIRLRSAVRKIDIIGRVSPAERLLSIKMNDWPQKPNSTGLFQSSISVKSEKTPVRVVAVDSNGVRSSLDFVIQANAETPASPPDTRVPGGKLPVLDFGKYHALVIGNDNYSSLTNLRTARNDAREVARVLKDKYGFRTTLLLDADRYTMYSALETLRRELTEKDNLLIYYAGHGELDRVNQRGYWLPVDAEPDSTANWIPNVAITDIINVMAAKHILVVADSCYSGTLTRASVARLDTGMTSSAKNRWYQAMARARTRIVLSSGGVQPVVDSGGGSGHSVFAKAFIDALNDNTGILEGYTLYRKVQNVVKNNPIASQFEQDPQYSPIKYAGHEAGEYLFPPVTGGAQLEDAWPAVAVNAGF